MSGASCLFASLSLRLTGHVCQLVEVVVEGLTAPFFARGEGHAIVGCKYFGACLFPHLQPPTSPFMVYSVEVFFFFFFLSCASKTSVSHHDGSGIISILLADGERPAPTQRQGRHCILFVHPFFSYDTPFDLFCW